MSRGLRPGISSLNGSDLLAVLPMGFGKSLIFQLLIRVKQILSSKSACVILSVRSKASCKIKHLFKMDLTATSLASASLQDVENGNYQLIFASAEEILAKPFLSSLKNRIYTTRKTVARLALKRLHLNHVVSERPKWE